MQDGFPPRQDQTAEDQLLELLGYSIIDIPMVQRRKEIARRVATTFAGYLRDKIEDYAFFKDESYSERVVSLSDLKEVLSMIDGEHRD
jgi:hypothetical protein